jgi:hypothetical protein
LGEVLRLNKNQALWVIAAMAAPIAFAGGFYVENQARTEPTGYSLRFLGHDVYCFDKNLVIDIYVENTGDTRFSYTHIEQDGWVVSLPGEQVEPREVTVLRAPQGGVEPGEQGYLTAYIGTYRDEYAELESMTVQDDSGQFWEERIYLGPTACFGGA